MVMVALNLETAVGREKDVQGFDGHRAFENLMVAILGNL